MADLLQALKDYRNHKCGEITKRLSLGGVTPLMAMIQAHNSWGLQESATIILLDQIIYYVEAEDDHGLENVTDCVDVAFKHFITNSLHLIPYMSHSAGAIKFILKEEAEKHFAG